VPNEEIVSTLMVGKNPLRFVGKSWLSESSFLKDQNIDFFDMD
jgi:hypothetical protein